MPSLVCADPMNLPKLLKKHHKSSVTSATDSYIDKCKKYLPQYPWHDNINLCTRCRCEIAKQIEEKINRTKKEDAEKQSEARKKAADKEKESNQKAARSVVTTVLAAIPNPTSTVQDQSPVPVQSTSSLGANISFPAVDSSEPAPEQPLSGLPSPSLSAISQVSGSGYHEDQDRGFSDSNSNRQSPVARVSTPSDEVGSTSAPATEVSAGGDYMDKDVAADALNKTLQSLGESPLAPGISRTRSKFREKIAKTGSKISSLFGQVGGMATSQPKICECKFCQDMISNIKKYFPKLQTKKEKYTMLTCMPPFVTIMEIRNELHISTHMARQASAFRNSHGPFYSPDFKSSAHPITVDVKQKVLQYYMSDDNSRVSPNTRDTLKVKDEDGKTTIEARRYMLVNAKDAYVEFKKENEMAKIGATKFITLKPKQCKWPGSKGFPVSCTCIIHENVKLIVDGLKNACIDNVSNVADDNNAATVSAVLNNINELVNFVLCPNATEKCFIGVCSFCPNEESLDLLFHYISDEAVEFSFWETKPTTTINKLCLSAEDFSEKFRTVLSNFMGHDYIYRQQKVFLAELKSNLTATPNTALINVDFGENYTFVVQNAVQGFHWSNEQATIHPVVVYYVKQEEQVISYKTYFVISDDLNHDASSFHVFRSRALELLKRDMPHINHVEYFSDGAGSQYKNFKNIINLVHHVQDFGLTAKWHFTATAHGKSMCDAMSAVVKRTCRLLSIRDGTNILSAEEMHKAIKTKLTSETLEFIYVTKNEVTLMRDILLERYRTAKKIPGIRKLHYLEIVENRMLLAKVYSNSDLYELFSTVIDMEENVNIERNFNVGEFVAVMVCRSYQIGTVIAFDDTAGECKLSLMRKTGKGGVALQWPVTIREQIVPFADILSRVAVPQATTGLTYRLTLDDLNTVKQALTTRMQQLRPVAQQ